MNLRRKKPWKKAEEASKAEKEASRNVEEEVKSVEEETELEEEDDEEDLVKVEMNEEDQKKWAEMLKKELENNPTSSKIGGKYWCSTFFTRTGKVFLGYHTSWGESAWSKYEEKVTFDWFLARNDSTNHLKWCQSTQKSAKITPCGKSFAWKYAKCAIFRRFQSGKL